MEEKKKLTVEELRAEVSKFTDLMCANMEAGDGRCMFLVVNDGLGTSEGFVGTTKSIGESILRVYAQDEQARDLFSLLSQTIMTFEALGPKRAMEFAQSWQSKKGRGKVVEVPDGNAEA